LKKANIYFAFWGGNATKELAMTENSATSVMKII
jgi:hypothetical protein